MTASIDRTETATTRESWLEAAVDVFRERFVEVGYPLPKLIHVSVGFAYGARAESGKVLGQAWKARASEDKAPHVFISPEIGDTSDVLETLLHELVHVAVDVAEPDKSPEHKGLFAEIATRLGFLGPMTATPSSVELAAELVTIAAVLGDYPHGALKVPARSRKTVGAPVGGGTTIKLSSGPAKQTNRYFVVECRNVHCDGCGAYKARMVRKWLDIAAPACGICGVQMIEV